jgi:hypothetical protein
LWLREKLETDGAAKRMFNGLLRSHQSGEHVRLACFCAPLACHAGVIKELLLERAGLAPTL